MQKLLEQARQSARAKGQLNASILTATYEATDAWGKPWAAKALASADLYTRSAINDNHWEDAIEDVMRPLIEQGRHEDAFLALLLVNYERGEQSLWAFLDQELSAALAAQGHLLPPIAGTSNLISLCSTRLWERKEFRVTSCEDAFLVEDSGRKWISCRINARRKATVCAFGGMITFFSKCQISGKCIMKRQSACH